MNRLLRPSVLLAVALACSPLAHADDGRAPLEQLDRLQGQHGDRYVRAREAALSDPAFRAALPQLTRRPPSPSQALACALRYRVEHQELAAQVDALLNSSSYQGRMRREAIVGGGGDMHELEATGTVAYTLERRNVDPAYAYELLAHGAGIEPFPPAWNGLLLEMIQDRRFPWGWLTGLRGGDACEQVLLEVYPARASELHLEAVGGKDGEDSLRQLRTGFPRRAEARRRGDPAVVLAFEQVVQALLVRLLSRGRGDPLHEHVAATLFAIDPRVGAPYLIAALRAGPWPQQCLTQVSLLRAPDRPEAKDPLMSLRPRVGAALVARLAQTTDPERRRLLGSLCVKLRYEGAVPELTKTLHADPDRYEHVDQLHSLACGGTYDALLSGWARSAAVEDRLAALTALARPVHGLRGAPLLAAATRDPEFSVREAALRALGDLGVRLAEQQVRRRTSLSGCLQEVEPPEDPEAERAERRMPPEAVAAIRSACRDPDPIVRALGLRCLAKLAGAGCLEVDEDLRKASLEGLRAEAPVDTAAEVAARCVLADMDAALVHIVGHLSQRSQDWDPSWLRRRLERHVGWRAAQRALRDPRSALAPNLSRVESPAVLEFLLEELRGGWKVD